MPLLHPPPVACFGADLGAECITRLQYRTAPSPPPPQCPSTGTGRGHGAIDWQRSGTPQCRGTGWCVRERFGRGLLQSPFGHSGRTPVPRDLAVHALCQGPPTSSTRTAVDHRCASPPGAGRASTAVACLVPPVTSNSKEGFFFERDPVRTEVLGLGPAPCDYTLGTVKVTYKDGARVVVHRASPHMNGDFAVTLALFWLGGALSAVHTQCNY